MVKFDEEEHSGDISNTSNHTELNHNLQNPLSSVLEDALSMNDRKESQHPIQPMYNRKLEAKFTKQDYVVLGCIFCILSIVGVASFYPLQKLIHHPLHLHNFISKYIAPYTRRYTALFFALLGAVLLS